MFATFTALILVSHLDHKMKESKIYDKYTMSQLFDKLDVIKCFEDPGHSLRIEGNTYETTGNLHSTKHTGYGLVMRGRESKLHS